MSSPQPSSPIAQQLLTQALSRLQFGDLTGAQKLLEQSIQLEPTAEAYYQLGNCFRRLRQAGPAEAAFNHSIEKDSGLAPAWFGLCFLYEENGRKEEAAEYLSKIVNNFTHDPRIQHQAGGLMGDFGLYKDAAATYERILQREPEARNHLRLGQYYQKLGRYEDAAREFGAALDSNPDMGAAYLLLAHTRRFTDTDQDKTVLRRFSAAVKDRSLNRTTQICLNFALGKIYDDLDACDTAFVYFAEGNALRHETEQFGAEDWLDTTRQVEALKPSNIAPLHTSSGKGPRPLFLVGMLRSGTTLLERVLSSHPQVTSLGEASWLNYLVARVMEQASLPYPACLTAIPESNVDELREDYLRRWPKSRRDAHYVLDKNPLNFLYLGLVARLFPDARVVHCRRDARDTGLSVYFQNFANTENTYAYDLADIARFHNGYSRMMQHWKRILPHGMMHEVSYEDLVTGQEAETRALLQNLHLPWDERCLKFESQPDGIATASVWQARQPLYSRSIGRWKRYERHLGPLLKALAS